MMFASFDDIPFPSLAYIYPYTLFNLMSNPFICYAHKCPEISLKAQRSLDIPYLLSRSSFYQNLVRISGNQGKSLANEKAGQTPLFFAYSAYRLNFCHAQGALLLPGHFFI
jgi:hypothetical protein